MHNLVEGENVKRSKIVTHKKKLPQKREINLNRAFDFTKNGPKLIHSVEIAHNLEILEFFCHSDFTRNQFLGY